MLDLNLNLHEDRSHRVLCIGAHCDDIEIGCGGTLLSLAHSRPDLEMVWAIFSGSDARKKEARHSARSFFDAPDVVEIYQADHDDGRIPYDPVKAKESFEKLKSQCEPDLIFTHSTQDAHQDHRFLAELTWQTFRDHLILEYEIPKFDGDIGNPGFFVPLDADIVKRKVDHIMRAFPSQSSRDWFEPELFRSILRIRGMECRSPSGYAEAFFSRKLRLLP
jgi:LmbE family N-acetylglucosaminyl deacetylase